MKATCNAWQKTLVNLTYVFLFENNFMNVESPDSKKLILIQTTIIDHILNKYMINLKQLLIINLSL